MQGLAYGLLLGSLVGFGPVPSGASSGFGPIPACMDATRAGIALGAERMERCLVPAGVDDLLAPPTHPDSDAPTPALEELEDETEDELSFGHGSALAIDRLPGSPGLAPVQAARPLPTPPRPRLRC